MPYELTNDSRADMSDEEAFDHAYYTYVRAIGEEPQPSTTRMVTISSEQLSELERRAAYANEEDAEYFRFLDASGVDRE